MKNDAYYIRKLQEANQQIEHLMKQIQEYRDELSAVHLKLYNLRKEAKI